MDYYKILNEQENHNGFQFKTGLNVDTNKFNPSWDCQPGGIYFSREDILAFICWGPWLRKVTIPKDAQVYKNPGSPKKWKADKIILSEREKIGKDTIIRLIQEGADIHADGDYALQWASGNGHVEVVKLLIEHGADIHASNDNALQWASKYGHVEVVKLLIEHGADIHANNDLALKGASEKGQVEVVKLLKGETKI